jgi:hypothetical protein
MTGFSEQMVQDLAAAADENELLRAVYRRLVGIHSSVNEATNDDREIVPWAGARLRELVFGISGFHRRQREMVAVEGRDDDE